MDDYGPLVARAYASYRPPLHPPILGSVLDRCYQRGLDYGCGTGQSALALADYCREVVAFDRSAAMLELATPSPRVHYLPLVDSGLPVLRGHVDLLTLAGVLPYCKSQRLLDQLLAVCRPGARIIVYDFDCTLLSGDDWIVPQATTGTVPYDHALDFDGLDTSGLQRVTKRERTVTLDLSVEQLAWLALADAGAMRFFSRGLGAEGLVSRVRARLRTHYCIDTTIPITFATYLTVYQVDRR